MGKLKLLPFCVLAALCAIGPAPLLSQAKFELDTSAFQSIQAYTQPGIVSFKGSKWVGNDHLYNLSKEVHVIAEIAKPPGTSIVLTAGVLRVKVEEQLKKGGLDPSGTTAGKDAILPFLHVLVLVYPVEGGFAAACSTRLFEPIGLDRVKAQAGVTWQGITWSKETLIVASKDELGPHIQTSVSELVEGFVKRYAFYQKLKSQLSEKGD